MYFITNRTSNQARKCRKRHTQEATLGDPIHKLKSHKSSLSISLDGRSKTWPMGTSPCMLGSSLAAFSVSPLQLLRRTKRQVRAAELKRKWGAVNIRADRLSQNSASVKTWLAAGDWRLAPCTATRDKKNSRT
ncbi:hypothetical protein I7I50_04003 [Histoplasma capsulatum G186AR]|uniref:Uncharacterized protein n=1 Tax=Ajellomyces capsulatus TaxID=5037 RepID=A0A8H7YNZ1_AJECA|nr:hypothetical protein I7I52_04911 [Histoplasma capsulatum]QSS75009.1 hypothetical protein I7I50_04003 [Histoplasma capsulatum G186AR]